MSTQYCKVGKIKPDLNSNLSLKQLESRIRNFVDDISKIDSLKGIRIQ